MRLLQILGVGCPKCEKLAANAEAAAKAAGVEYQLEKIKDIQRITAFGVMTTPALMIDGEVKVVGRVPSVEELKEMIAEDE
ncbi:TM0996/MTH895 family glutaredoxin-like protein [bacterium]|nr:TM0996/MTH895 family glutaredoxin-like protein [bacterium]MBU1983103.1 TM0996/MTH895 family glutaredoxin-like protein [bacterium]